ARDVVADHVDLRAHLDSRPDRLQIELQQASGVLPGDSLGIEDLHAAVTIQGDSIRVDDFRLRTAGSRLQGALRVVPRTPLARGQLELEALDLSEVSRFVPAIKRRGRLQGNLHFGWTPASTQLRGTVEGVVDSLELRDLEFDTVLAPNDFRVRHVQARVAGAQLEAQFQERKGELQGVARFENADLRRILRPPPEALPEHRLTGLVRFHRATPQDSLRLTLDLD